MLLIVVTLLLTGSLACGENMQLDMALMELLNLKIFQGLITF
jgi:hypothetical protein